MEKKSLHMDENYVLALACSPGIRTLVSSRIAHNLAHRSYPTYSYQWSKVVFPYDRIVEPEWNSKNIQSDCLSK